MRLIIPARGKILSGNPSLIFQFWRGESGEGEGGDRGTMLDWTTFYSDKFGISEKLVPGSG